MKTLAICLVLLLTGSIHGVTGELSARQQVKVDDKIYPVYLYFKEVKPVRTMAPTGGLAEAVLAGQGGRVVVGVVVNEKGKAISTFVSESTATREVQHAARMSVATWRFPKMKDGATPISYAVFVPLDLRPQP